jgi:hypothetical protein
MNTISLGSFDVYEPPIGGHETNDMTLYTSASRYGIGRFLMRRLDYDQLILNDTAVLTMTSSVAVNGSSVSSTVSFSVIVAGAVPYSVACDGLSDSEGSRTQNDFVEVYVYDARFYMRTPIDFVVNVQQAGFSTFYPSTLNSGVEYTWAEAVAASTFSLTWPTLPTTWKPRNLIFDMVPVARLLDSIAETLRIIAGYSPFTNTVVMYAPGAESANNSSLLASTLPYKISGRPSDRHLKKMPGTYRVVFKYYSTDLFANRYYTKDVAGTLGGSASNVYVIHVGEYVALWNGATASNSAELDAVAADIAARTEAFMSTTPDEAVYAGWWPFEVDGYIRAVRWYSTREGAFTAVRMNSDRDFFPADTQRKTLDAVANQLVTGLGGQQSGMALNGSRLVWPSGSGGGVSGTITASSSLTLTSWAYTCQSYTGAIVYAPCRNGCEPCEGSPGKLGVNVASDGTVNGGACVVQPIGVGCEVDLRPDPTTPGGWLFSVPNSAQ